MDPACPAIRNVQLVTPVDIGCYRQGGHYGKMNDEMVIPWANLSVAEAQDDLLGLALKHHCVARGKICVVAAANTTGSGRKVVAPEFSSVKEAEGSQ